jgi:predicted HD superfamily hydrolase involved in NAD metabolism
VRVGPERLAHCERTAALCRAVAEARPDLGVDPSVAALAGLLHDWGRGEGSAEAILAAAVRLGVPVGRAARRRPVALLHAPVGAALLREQGLDDDAILRAVSRHTAGEADMGALDLLVYTADFCEPGRSHEGAAEVRALLRRDLRAAARLATRHTMEHLLAQGEMVETSALDLWNDLVADGEEASA